MMKHDEVSSYTNALISSSLPRPMLVRRFWRKYTLERGFPKRRVIYDAGSTRARNCMVSLYAETLGFVLSVRGSAAEPRRLCYACPNSICLTV